jgi:hypothetical protein
MTVPEEFSRLSGAYSVEGHFKKSKGRTCQGIADQATDIIGQAADCGTNKIANVIDVANATVENSAGISGGARSEPKSEIAAKVSDMAPMPGKILPREMGKLKELNDRCGSRLCKNAYRAMILPCRGGRA